MTCSIGAASAAPAPQWSTPATFVANAAAPQVVGEGTPRVGVAADGTAVLTYTKTLGTGRNQRRELWAATGTRSGRFSTPRLLTRANVSSYSAAAAVGGDRIVVWSAPDGLRDAVHHRGRWTTRRLTEGARSPIESVQVAADPNGGWPVAVKQFYGRRASIAALDLDAAGRSKRLDQLGDGDFGNEARPVFALTVDEAGTAVLAYRDVSQELTGVGAGALVRVRPHGGAWTGATGVARLADARVSPHPDGGAVLAGTLLVRRGDIGSFGPSATSLVSADGAVGPLSSPALAHPNRAFNASAVALTGGQRLLVGNLRDAPKAFSATAPVTATTIAADGTAGAVSVLDDDPSSSEPIALPLAGRRAVVLWSGARRWGAALTDDAGVARPTASPPGAPPAPYHFNATNRDLRSAGRYVAVAWERRGQVRVTIRRF